MRGGFLRVQRDASAEVLGEPRYEDSGNFPGSYNASPFGSGARQLSRCSASWGTDVISMPHPTKASDNLKNPPASVCLFIPTRTRRPESRNMTSPPSMVACRPKDRLLDRNDDGCPAERRNGVGHANGPVVVFLLRQGTTTTASRLPSRRLAWPLESLEAIPAPTRPNRRDDWFAPGAERPQS